MNILDLGHSKENNDSYGQTNSNIKFNNHINFVNYTQRYCIGIIDIVNSTMETANLVDPQMLRKYYSLFLNTMSSIIKNFKGKIVKNAGDNLFFYFPKTADESNYLAFFDAIDCGLMMILSKKILDRNFVEEGLQPINYRVSMDYGEVEIALSYGSNDVDLFGPVVNNCSKINHLTPSNAIGLSENLYKAISKFKFVDNYSINKIKIRNKSIEHGMHDNLYIINLNNQSLIQHSNIRRLIEQNRNRKFKNQNYSTNSSYNIMVIDDDEDILYTFQTVLRRKGYNVHSFSDSTKALNHILTKSVSFYDLIVMDIRMPGINGIQLYYKLKAINPDANILIISALDILQEIIDSMLGVDTENIIKKPIEAEDFTVKIESILRST